MLQQDFSQTPEKTSAETEWAFFIQNTVAKLLEPKTKVIIQFIFHLH